MYDTLPTESPVHIRHPTQWNSRLIMSKEYNSGQLQDCFRDTGLREFITMTDGNKEEFGIEGEGEGTFFFKFIIAKEIRIGCRISI